MTTGGPDRDPLSLGAYLLCVLAGTAVAVAAVVLFWWALTP